MCCLYFDVEQDGISSDPALCVTMRPNAEISCSLGLSNSACKRQYSCKFTARIKMHPHNNKEVCPVYLLAGR